MAVAKRFSKSSGCNSDSAISTACVMKFSDKVGLSEINWVYLLINWVYLLIMSIDRGYTGFISDKLGLSEIKWVYL